MKLNRRNSQRALTLPEVLVVIAVIVVLVVLLLPNLSPKPTGDQARATRNRCINNLKQVGLGFRQWAIDHGDQYPMSVSVTNGGASEYVASGDVFRIFLMLSNELNTPKILVCPADTTRSPVEDFASLLSNTNVSYFAGLDVRETFPSMFLTGDRNLTNDVPLPPNRIMELTSKSVVGWTGEIHQHWGNVGLADGSVQSFSSSKLREALSYTGLETNRLAMPWY